MEEFEGFFRWLNQAHDLNITIGYDAYDRAQYLRGLWTTIRLSVICVVLSLLIGVLGAWAQGARFAPVRWAMHGYVAFFRNTPPLIQLYFFFFALGSVLPALVGGEGARPLVGNFAWAVAVKLEELDGPWGDFMREVVTEWHSSGKLIELNAKWGIKDNPFLAEMNEKLKAD